MEMFRCVDYSKLDLAIYRQYFCVGRDIFSLEVQPCMFALLIGPLTVLGPPIRTIEMIKAFFMK